MQTPCWKCSLLSALKGPSKEYHSYFSQIPQDNSSACQLIQKTVVGVGEIEVCMSVCSHPMCVYTCVSQCGANWGTPFTCALYEAQNLNSAAFRGITNSWKPRQVRGSSVWKWSWNNWYREKWLTWGTRFGKEQHDQAAQREGVRGDKSKTLDT